MRTILLALICLGELHAANAIVGGGKFGTCFAPSTAQSRTHCTVLCLCLGEICPCNFSVFAFPLLLPFFSPSFSSFFFLFSLTPYNLSNQPRPLQRCRCVSIRMLSLIHGGKGSLHLNLLSLNAHKEMQHWFFVSPQSPLPLSLLATICFWTLLQPLGHLQPLTLRALRTIDGRQPLMSA